MSGEAGGNTGAYGSAVSSIASTISSLYAAKAAKEVAKYNQTIYNIQAGIIEANHKFEKEKFAQMRKSYMGTGIATISAQNVGMGRTSLSLLNKSMENLFIDEAYSDYNAKMNANTMRSQGTIARASGEAQATAYYTQAGNTLSKGLSDYAAFYKKQNSVGGNNATV